MNSLTQPLVTSPELLKLMKSESNPCLGALNDESYGHSIGKHNILSTNKGIDSKKKNRGSVVDNWKTNDGSTIGTRCSWF